VHPRARSPIFHHFKAQFASTPSDDPARRRSNDEFALSSLSFSTFFYRARPRRCRLWQPSTTVVYHSASTVRVFTYRSLFRLDTISDVITRDTELIKMNLYRDWRSWRELRSLKKHKNANRSEKSSIDERGKEYEGHKSIFNSWHIYWSELISILLCLDGFFNWFVTGFSPKRI